MKIKIIAVRFVISLLSFLIGFLIFKGWNWIKSDSQISKLETPLTIIDKKPIIIQNHENPTNDEALAEEKPTFKEGGFFYIIGKKPKAFKDFHYFELVVWDYEKTQNKLIPAAPSGEVYSTYSINSQKFT